MSISLLSSNKRIGVYSLIGVILLASGLSLTLYHRVASVEVTGFYTVSLENGYSFNMTLLLNKGDRLLIYISPLKQVNYSLTIENSFEIMFLNAVQIDKTLLVNVNFTEPHIILVSEHPPFQYTQIRFEIIRFTSTPSYNYIFLGVPLTVTGLTLSFTGLREFKFFRKRLGNGLRFNLAEFSLIAVFLLSYAFMTLLLPDFIISVIFQNWVTIILLIFFSTVNMISVYRCSMKFTGEKSRLFSILLTALAYLWVSTSIILLLQSQILVLEYYEPGSIIVFNLIREFTLNYSIIYFQIMIFNLIPSVFYIHLSYSWLQGSYLEYSTGLNQPPVEENPLTVLKNNLTASLNKRDLAGFFNLLKEASLEASVILFLVVREYVEGGGFEFTYHKLILEYSGLFNKKLYERKPVERVLIPLGFIKPSSGRVKIFRLNTGLEEVGFIVNLLNTAIDNNVLSLVEAAAGVGELRERKIKFSGV